MTRYRARQGHGRIRAGGPQRRHPARPGHPAEGGRPGRTGPAAPGPVRITPLAAAYPTLTADGRKARAADVPSPSGAPSHPGEPVG